MHSDRLGGWQVLINNVTHAVCNKFIFLCTHTSHVLLKTNMYLAIFPILFDHYILHNLPFYIVLFTSIVI